MLREKNNSLTRFCRQLPSLPLAGLEELLYDRDLENYVCFFIFYFFIFRAQGSD